MGAVHVRLTAPAQTPAEKCRSQSSGVSSAGLTVLFFILDVDEGISITKIPIKDYEVLHSDRSIPSFLGENAQAHSLARPRSMKTGYVFGPESGSKWLIYGGKHDKADRIGT